MPIQQPEIDQGRRGLFRRLAILTVTLLAIDVASEGEPAYGATKRVSHFRNRRASLQTGKETLSSVSTETKQQAQVVTQEIPQGQPVTLQETPTPDATVTELQKQLLAQQVQQAENQNNNWLLTNLVFPALTGAGAVAALGTIGVNLYLRRRDERIEKEKQAEERFQKDKDSLKSEHIETRTEAAIDLSSFLNPNPRSVASFGRFHEQIFDLAVSYLRIRARSSDTGRLDPFYKAIMTLFVDSFPLANKLMNERYAKKGLPYIPHFQYVDFTGADLQNLDFTGAELSGSIFHNADLQGANLKKIHVKTTNFVKDTTEIDKTGMIRLPTDYPTSDEIRATYPEIIFTEADMRGTSLQEAYLPGATFTKANLRFSSLRKAKIPWAEMIETKLTQADLAEVEAQQANLTKAILSGANLSGTQLHKANFTEANLANATLRQADLAKADFTKANLSDANLSNTYAQEANLHNANLEGANLTNADLRRANLTGTFPEKARTLWGIKMDNIQELMAQGFSEEQIKQFAEKGATFDLLTAPDTKSETK